MHWLLAPGRWHTRTEYPGRCCWHSFPDRLVFADGDEELSASAIVSEAARRTGTGSLRRTQRASKQCGTQCITPGFLRVMLALQSRRGFWNLRNSAVSLSGCALTSSAAMGCQARRPGRGTLDLQSCQET
jgi:hypothetical protein